MNARHLLGRTVRDLVTGFEGVAVGVTEYMYACSRVTVEPKRADKDGGLLSTESFDCMCLEIVEDAPVIEREVVFPAVPMYSMVRDGVSGIEGRVVALATNLFRDPAVGVQPLQLKEDGSPNEPHFIEEDRIEVLSEDNVPVAKWAKKRQPAKKDQEGEATPPKTGGPQPLVTSRTSGGMTRGLR